MTSSFSRGPVTPRNATSDLAIPTPSPASSKGLILEVPSSVVDARQMMGLPPGDRAPDEARLGRYPTVELAFELIDSDLARQVDCKA